MKKMLLILLLATNMQVFAGGHTTFATPTRIDVVQGKGFMVHGDFGNPGSCTIANKFFVEKTNTQYDQIYATILSAYLAKRRVSIYSHTCEPVGWYSVTSTTYNYLKSYGALSVAD